MITRTQIFLRLLSCAACIPALALAAELKQLDPSRSDALFDPHRVIQIEIRMDPKDWLALRVSHPVLDDTGGISTTERGYEYFKGDVVIDGRAVAAVGVRKKGSYGSANNIRPSLKIKFDEYLKDQALDGLDMLTLNNCMHDPTKAQQVLVYSFMAKAGVPAPRANLARVIVNGEDLGIYGHVESIRKPFFNRVFSKANGDLYENVAAADLTTNAMHRLTHKWGKDKTLAHVKQLVDLLERPKAMTLAEIEALVDLNAFIKFWAAEVLIGHVDGYPSGFNNFYLYRDADSGKFAFIPWGADSAFIDWQLRATPKSVKARGYLCQRLWEFQEVQDRYREQMRRFLAEVWDEKAMIADLERIAKLCEGDRDRDSARVKESTARVVRFIQDRRAALKPELEGPTPVWPAMPRLTFAAKPVDTHAPMQIEGTFSAVVVDAFPPPHPKTHLPFPTNIHDYFGQGTATVQFTINGQTHKPFTKYGATATAKDGTYIRIAALNPADNFLWNVLFDIFPYCLTPGVSRPLELWTIHASVLQGDPHSAKAQFKWGIKKNGTLELTQVSTNLGGTIAGKFRIHTTAFAEAN